MNRILVDLGDHRLRLDDPARLDWASGGTVVVGAVLDTGSGSALIGPRSMLTGSVPEDFGRTRIDGFGGQIAAITFDATLSFPRTDRVFPVQVVLAEHPTVDRWYIGLPVLKHFDLMLRSTSDHPHGPHLRW